jgi:carbon monoxide dehydrogenase subunit G
MEHEVLVPLSPHTVRRSLRRPELLARCLPGFAPDEPTDAAGSDESTAAASTTAPGPADRPLLAGRLKLRIGNSSITYRGTLRLSSAADPDELLLVVSAEQSVGAGGVSGTVRVGALPGEADGSCRIVFDCSVSGLGRIAELAPQSVELAARRLLDRFCATLVVELDAHAPDGPRLFEDLDGLPELPELPELTELGEFSGLSDLSELSELSELSDLDAPELFLIEESVTSDGTPGPDEPWADEPPHRRSIVGRSAEEVDHAPPRGRYGPAVPPRSARSRAAARWGAPERRMGEPPSADGDSSRTPWLVGGGVAVVGGIVLLARALRKR